MSTSLIRAEVYGHERLAEGIEYTHLGVTTPRNFSIHMLDIDLSRVSIKIVTAQDQGGSAKTSVLAKKESALAAINGGFYKSDGSSAGILKISGILIAEQKKMPRGALGWTSDGKTVCIDYVSEDQQQRSRWEGIDNVVGGTPILIKNNELIADYSQEKILQSFIENRYARTAVGILPNRHVLVVVVDDKGSLAEDGMTLPELANFMKSLGCVDAINLCGGKSSTMCIKDQVVTYSFGIFYLVDYLVGSQREKEVAHALLFFPRDIHV